MSSHYSIFTIVGGEDGDMTFVPGGSEGDD